MDVKGTWEKSEISEVPLFRASQISEFESGDDAYDYDVKSEPNIDKINPEPFPCASESNRMYIDSDCQTVSIEMSSSALAKLVDNNVKNLVFQVLNDPAQNRNSE